MSPSLRILLFDFDPGLPIFHHQLQRSWAVAFQRPFGGFFILVFSHTIFSMLCSIPFGAFCRPIW